MLHVHERIATRRMDLSLRIFFGPLHAGGRVVGHPVRHCRVDYAGCRHGRIVPTGHPERLSRAHVVGHVGNRRHGGTSQGSTHYSHHVGLPRRLFLGIEVYLLSLYAGAAPRGRSHFCSRCGRCDRQSHCGTIGFLKSMYCTNVKRNEAI